MPPFLAALTIAAVVAVVALVYPRRRQIGYMAGLVTELLPPAAYGPAQHTHTHTHTADGGGGRSLRWAIVTGASRGIGRGFVRALARDGWSVLCLDMDDSELEGTVEEALATGMFTCIHSD